MTAKHAESLTAGGIPVALSHTDKVLFPGRDEITKGDLIEYYAQVADRMLPYLRERPIAMARYPDGISGQRIFQKNVPDYFPDWVTRAEEPGPGHTEQRKDKRARHLYVDVMRNAYAQTVVAPYVVRARPGAPVAVPLHWDEVADSDLEPGRFTLRTVRRRLDELDQAADPWADLTRRRYSLTEARSRLDELARSRSTESAGGS